MARGEHVIAAILICAWSYQYVGEKLGQIEGASTHEYYGEWVQTYSSKDFKTFRDDTMRLMNLMEEGRTESELQALEDIVMRTSYYEYFF